MRTNSTWQTQGSRGWADPRRVGAAGAALLALLVASPAAAETPKPQNYGYTFDDDLLQGADLDASAPQIVVRNYLRRDRLMRPRLQFVDQLIKSVEAL